MMPWECGEAQVPLAPMVPLSLATTEFACERHNRL
jgi:hypothetical protein